MTIATTTLTIFATITANYIKLKLAGNFEGNVELD